MYDRNKFTIFPSSKALHVLISSRRPDGPDIYNDILLDMLNIKRVKLDPQNGRISFQSPDAFYQINPDGRHVFINRRIPLKVSFTTS